MQDVLRASDLLCDACEQSEADADNWEWLSWLLSGNTPAFPNSPFWDGTKFRYGEFVEARSSSVPAAHKPQSGIVSLALTSNSPDTQTKIAMACIQNWTARAKGREAE